MTLKRYGGSAKFEATGRMRKFVFIAKDEADCREKLLADGYIEPFTIEPLPPELATQNQIDYAKDLGLRFPPDISMSDMSILLDKGLSNDSDPNPELLEFAYGRNLCSSPYIGKKALYNLIFEELHGTERVAFFLFSIYRYCSDDRRGNLDTHPRKDVFFALAEDLAYEPRFMSSLRTYDGQELRYFGTLLVGDRRMQGGSTQTIAYKMAMEALQSFFSIQSREIHHYTPSTKIQFHSHAENKWFLFFVCLFFGLFGGHKFYEGKFRMGCLYLVTMAYCGIGWINDLIDIFNKPDYYFD